MKILELFWKIHKIPDVGNILDTGVFKQIDNELEGGQELSELLPEEQRTKEKINEIFCLHN